MMKNIKTVFAREFKSYFDSPVAYVFLVAFLVLVGFMTFGVAMFYERRQADLTPFFFWHPWVYLLLIQASTMGLWADERRNGTIELLLTLPITLWEALIGKFLAAWAFIAIALMFALIRVNPSPFCIFDEIEAALDEVNVARVGRYISKMSRDMQIIMISHRRGTMDIADSLYGVTMPQSGVSKVFTLGALEEAAGLTAN